MINALIIDDEYQSRKALINKVTRFCPQVYIADAVDSVPAAKEAIILHQPQLIFLDIHLNRLSGFDLLKQFKNPKFHVIFVTGFNDYAIQAFKCCALDYLLKPVDTQELISAVKKAESQIELEQIRLKYFLQNLEQKKEQDKVIVIPSLENDEFVRIENIVRFEAQGGYTYIYKKDKDKICASKNLKHFEDALTEQSQFFRVHHKHLINTQFVIRYDRIDCVAILEHKQHIPVAQRRRAKFIDFMRKNGQKIEH